MGFEDVIWDLECRINEDSETYLVVRCGKRVNMWRRRAFKRMLMKLHWEIDDDDIAYDHATRNVLHRKAQCAINLTNQEKWLYERLQEATR